MYVYVYSRLVSFQANLFPSKLQTEFQQSVNVTKSIFQSSNQLKNMPHHARGRERPDHTSDQYLNIDIVVDRVDTYAANLLLVPTHVLHIIWKENSS